MFDALKAAGWRDRFIAPALKQAALLNGHVAEQPDLMILVELWLWAVFFRFSGEYRALTPHKQAKLRSEAFTLSYFDYYNIHKDRLAALMREVEPKLGLTEPSKVLIGFQQLVRPTFEHSVIEAQQLPPLHENFDLSTFRRVLSKVHPTFLDFPGMTVGVYDAERQRNLKLITQVAAVGQAQLYATLTGMLIPSDRVLISEAQIPDLSDVFISYARFDSHFVADLAARLEKSGIRAWYDRRIQPEEQFDQAISDQIAAAKVVLTVWSSASVNSKWVRAESLAGFNADKLMQLRCGGCSIPTPFNIVQTIDAHHEGLAPDDYESLIQAIRRKMRALPSAEEVGDTTVEVTLGTQHIDTLTALANLGATEQERGNHIRAAQLLEEALDGLYQALGTEHPTSLGVKNNLCMALSSGGEHERAQQMALDTLDAYRRLVGKVHQQTLAVTMNAVGTHLANGNMQGVQAIWDRLLEDQTSALGPEHPYTLQTLLASAWTEALRGEVIQARDRTQQATRISKRLYGDRNPLTQACKDQLTQIEQLSKRPR